jgi:DNA (cytosine-5)-methyltransferase 1
MTSAATTTTRPAFRLPRVLDLFCCEGGAARGYAAAGLEVVGIDIENRGKNYPYEFHQADAIAFLLEHGREFDLIHASPPCQGYSPHVSSASSKWVPTLGKDEPRLIEPLRAALQQVNRPYVIENVMGARAALNSNLMLCGTMFGLPISRHRIFETSFQISQPEHPQCRGVAKRFAAERGWEYRDMSVTGKGRRAGTAERWREIMGIHDEIPMSQSAIAEAIPPAFAQYIGSRFVIGQIRARAAAASQT